MTDTDRDTLARQTTTLADEVAERAAILAALGPERVLGLIGDDHHAHGYLRDLRDALDSVLRPLARMEYEDRTGRVYPDGDDDGEDYYPSLVPVILGREQATAWAGRDLTRDEVRRLTDAIPHSSIPEAVATITEGLS